MSEETTKTMSDVVKEVRSRKTETTQEGPEKTLLDEFAMAALSGFLASNNAKDTSRRSYIVAQEMMDMRQKAMKGKLKD